MPFAKCPTCGNVAHVNVIDPAAWYAERYPDLPFMTQVAASCFHCHYELAIGDVVMVRKHFTEHASWAPVGCHATITRVTSCEQGKVFHVDVRGGKDESFVCGELRRPRKNYKGAD